MHFATLMTTVRYLGNMTFRHCIPDAVATFESPRGLPSDPSTLFLVWRVTELGRCVVDLGSCVGELMCCVLLPEHTLYLPSFLSSCLLNPLFSLAMTQDPQAIY